MAENKTTINMELVDPIPTEEKQETTPAPVQDPPKEPPKNEEVKEKPGFFRAVWNGITFVPRWAYKKVKESPAAGAIGMIAGTALGVGGKVLYDHFGHRASSGDDEAGFIPADPVEIDTDFADDYVSSDDSVTYTNNTEE